MSEMNENNGEAYSQLVPIIPTARDVRILPKLRTRLDPMSDLTRDFKPKEDGAFDPLAS
jgi:hypothetical protein